MSESQSPVSYTRHSPDAHVISSDEEAIAIAHEIALLLQPGAAERDRSGTVAPEIVDTFSNSGLWGITVPRQWGGAEVSAATLAQVIAIISAADPSLGQIPQNHYCLLEDIRLQGSAEQQAFFFGLVLQGHRFANALSETGGKTVLDIRTRLETRGDALYINGRKGYCTGSLYAHWIGILALDADDRAQLAFVPRDSAGLTVLDDWDCLGQRNTASGTVLAENLAVAPLHLFRRGNLMPRRRSPAPSRSSPPPRLMPGSPAQPSTTPSASFASSPDRGLMPASNGPATIRSPSTISGRSTADWPPLRRCWSRRARFSTALNRISARSMWRRLPSPLPAPKCSPLRLPLTPPAACLNSAVPGRPATVTTSIATGAMRAFTPCTTRYAGNISCSATGY